MSQSEETSRRLQELEQVLAESSAPASTRNGDGDPVDLHLASVPLERITAMTRKLQQRSTDIGDVMDTVTARLLLSDYTAAVGHLRAVARLAEQRIIAAAEPIHEGRVLVQRDRSRARAGTDAAPTSPGDTPPK